MDTRWRNLAAIVVVVAAVAVAYNFLFLPSQQPSFSEQYADLSAAWKSEGFSQETLHADFDALLALPEAKLNSIKGNLQAEAAAMEEGVAKEAAGLYVSLIDVALKLKEANALNESIDLSGNVCNSLPVLNEVNSKFSEFVDAANAFNADLEGFVDEFPTEAEEININRIGLGFEGMEAGLAADEDALALLEEGCP